MRPLNRYLWRSVAGAASVLLYLLLCYSADDNCVQTSAFTAFASTFGFILSIEFSFVVAKAADNESLGDLAPYRDPMLLGAVGLSLTLGWQLYEVFSPFIPD